MRGGDEGGIARTGRGVAGRQINRHSEEQHAVTVDRTAWLDMALGRFKTGRISLPVNTNLEYKAHVKAPVRIYEKDSDGNPVGKYVTGAIEDHYAHARCYSEVALSVAASIGGTQEVRGRL